MAAHAITGAIAPAARRPARLRGQARWFGVATALWALHVVDDAVVDRQPGVAFDTRLPLALLAVALAAVAVLSFSRLRPGARSLLALSLGVVAVAGGMLSAQHAVTDGPAGSDLTAALAAAAGVSLLSLAAWIPHRHRGERARGAGHRWRNRLIAIAGGVVLLYVVVLPVTVAVVTTTKPREAIGAPPSAAYRPVTFHAADGVRLSGWYVPSRNRAAVVIVHGGGGDRTGSLRHAALLARHGFGVLVYDARGRGASQGASNPFGWNWDKDVAGAVAFLRRRADVDPQRIGGLGLSTGADVLIQVAARRDDGLRAVVGDGATAESLPDVRNAGVSGTDQPYWAVMYAAASLVSGASPGRR